MKKKVLIVEDEFIVANDLGLILMTAGYTITGVAASKEEAEICLQKNKPDLVIIDIRLKGKPTGIDFARTLKAEDIAFIYLSANSNQKILEEAKTTDPYGFIVKPFRERDLLITLDIAWYRHRHSLESKLRRQEHLIKQLDGIQSEKSGFQEKMLKLTMAMQPYLSFDFISVGLRSSDTNRLDDRGYLRIGFDEYQFIGGEEFITITKLTKPELSTILKHTQADTETHIYANESSGYNTACSSLQEFIMGYFSFQSCLAFPITLGYGLSACYFFYSRKPDSYMNDHIVLLQRLKPYLEGLAAQIVLIDEPPTVIDKTTALPATNEDNRGAKQAAFKSIVGSHHLLLTSLDLAAQVAAYNTSVLILGESGTGKEKIAHAIHLLSPRKNKPFIKVNCAAIPETLVESELFGHEKGAFTGAVEKRKGRFEQANGGTIFLDEIGELPTAIQVKLLRVLQEKEIEPLGGSTTIKTDVRIVAATSRNLEKEVSAGNFRLDLYYRLNVFPIMLPPLRERKTDIEALTLFFSHKFCEAFRKPFNGIEGSMLEKMCNYDWPGNIRELENVVEQSIVLNDGRTPLQLKRSLIPSGPNMQGGNNVNTMADVKLVQQETEREHIRSVLKKTKGRVRGADGAAELLNIKPTTLEAKMAKLKISRQDFSSTADDL